MKIGGLLLLFLCSIALGYSQNYLRLMNYNIRNAKGMDEVHNYQRIANIILEDAPDVVAIQEADSVTRRSNQVDVLAEIAQRSRMHATYAATIDFQGGKYGLGILSKQQPLRVERVPLPGKEEARVLLVAEFNDYVFACTHLSLTAEDRMASYALIRQCAERYAKPFFLAGDWNDTPDSPFLILMQEDFALLNNPNVYTHPASKPHHTIDYIAAWKPTRPRMVVESAKVLDEPCASDHRPVSVRLRMAQRPEQLMTTKPYLQNPSEDAITIMWETAIPTYSWVEYGTDTTQLQRARLLVDGQADCSERIQKVRLQGLTAGTTYYYRVCSQEILKYQAYSKDWGYTAKSEFYSFTLPAAKADAFTAIVFNDLHKNSTVFQALFRQVDTVDYDFVVFNGDCIDDPSHHAQATHFIRELTEAVQGSRVPVFFVRGNHEIRNAYSVKLRRHFDYKDDKTYSAFNWGDTRIVLLDCGEDKLDSHPVYYDLNDFSQLRREQADFLQKEMTSKAFRKADRRLLIHHIPIYGNDGKNLCKELWKPLLKKAAFDVSIHGHTHKLAFHPEQELENPFPVVIGGGNRMENATVMVLRKTQDKLSVQVLNTQGETLLNVSF